jgi:hypothetical protein
MPDMCALVEMAQRVATHQTEKTKGKETATVVITENHVRVKGRTWSIKNKALSLLHQDKFGNGHFPWLLNAAIDTVICTVVSERTGVVVIVAYTWDGYDSHGIGCDVVRMRPKHCAAYAAAIQTSVNSLYRCTAEAQRAHTAVECIGASARLINTRAPPAPAPLEPSPQQRPSALEENETRGGCLTGDMVLNPELKSLDSRPTDDLAVSGDDLDTARMVSTNGDFDLPNLVPHDTCAADESSLCTAAHPFAQTLVAPLCPQAR